jgi:hypothetical protein
VDQLEVKEQDAGDPPVDSHIGLDIRVVQHAFEILSIYLHNKIFHSDDIDPVGMEGMEQTIQLELCLGILGQKHVGGNGDSAEHYIIVAHIVPKIVIWNYF